MPTTRSQAAEEKTLRVYEDFPASPSGTTTHDPTYTRPTTTEHVTTRPPAPQEAPPPPRDETTVQEQPTQRHRPPPSVHSQRSTASAIARIRQAELEAEERLAEIRKQELQIQAALIRKRLAIDIATIREETDRESICAEEAAETELRINTWLQSSQIRGEPREPEETETSLRYPSASRGKEREIYPSVSREKERERYPSATREKERERYPSATREKERERYPSATREKETTPGGHVNNKVTFETAQRQKSPMRPRDKGIDRLADALEQMARCRTPPRQTTELPLFSGNHGEWLPFKAAMQESTALYKFSPTENLARLRGCLRGEAKQMVSALLYTATDPAIIMRTLQQCYGRPEVIIDNALEEIKQLPRLGGAASELNHFAIKLQNIVTTITSLDERGFLYNPMLTRQVMEKINLHLKSRWCDYAEEYGSRSEPEIITLSHFLMREADRAMRHTYSATSTTGPGQMRNNRKSEQQPRTNDRNRRAKVYATTEDTDKKDICFCCGATHNTAKCAKLAAMPLSKRWEWAKEAHVCFRCLDNKHRRFHCKAKKCGINECRQPHHALLHSAKENTDKQIQKEESVVTASARALPEENQVLLKVCPITIRGKNGQEFDTHALLDEGSTITLIDQGTADAIGAQKGPIRALHIHGATSSQREPDSREVDIEIRGRNQTNFQTIKARTVKNLTLGSQTLRTDVLKQPHLRQLTMQDVCYTNAKPHILIGADNWHLIVTRKLITGKRNQPAASLTQLGWVIHGSTPRSVIEREPDRVLHVRTTQESHRKELSSNSDNELHDLVKAHFDIDALGISTKKKPVAKEERAERIFEQTVKRVNNRFEVGLPWNTDEVFMPPSYDMARSRLLGIERKMDKSPEFKNAYTAEVNKLLEKGYARQCEEEHTNDSKLWYLPHFAVTNPNKPGRMRLVFDAAASTNGMCLNDVLLDGPDLLQALHGVLFRFREKPIAITADIREMFLRIMIRPEDRVAQHFLWRGEDRTRPPRKYVMTSMIFGARSSPFLAHSVRNKNATEYKDSHPLAYEAITNNHYMDDWVDSYETHQLAERAIREVQEVHSKAGFELAGWSTNHRPLLKDIPEENMATTPRELGANSNPYGKTLGILWLPETDELAFNTTMHRVPLDVKNGTRTPTKREALGMVMSLFDPLGLLSPYTIAAKIMLQQVWKKRTAWDDPLPDEEAAMFEEWQEDLKTIVTLRLPRCYDKNGDRQQRQLHVFSDASESAIATAAYWRYTREDGSVNVVLAAGKAKVAPMKSQSIPRLELQACLLGARLATAIIKEHRVNVATTFWSDSKTALHWIRNDSSRYTPYVTHRLSEIAELTRIEQWRWTDTKNNPADRATRANHTELRSTDPWYTGPAFLRKGEEHWPQEVPTDHSEDSIVTYNIERSPLIDMQRYSSYERLVRTLARVLEFIDRCRRRSTALELKHIQEAERLLIIQSQNDSFANELVRLKKGHHVDKNSRLYKLDPKYVENVIRLNGRINAANVPDGLKTPPVLDGGHIFTRLLIKKEHENNHHVGREQLVNNLRQRYWILRLRPTVRKIVQECTWCRIRRAKPATPVKGDLPKARLEAYVKPFSYCGVDCFGPMWVTIGRRKEKRWGMLFTCMVTRAIHIELIPSLSTDSAIMALRRMAARRGEIKQMLSDNGTNFKGADIELRNAYQEWLPHLKNYALMKRIDWRFIDPGAPNQGGAWERQIGTVKRAIAATLHERAPREEILNTVMNEIEHTVNSRPLTHVSVDPEDAEALTPNHFLLGTSVGLPYVGECSIADKRTWRAAQAIANMFWARWINEYLPTLIPRGDVRKSLENIKVGDVVIIADGLLPRNVWPRGQVERVYVGPDGVVRSAEVRTRGGVFRRPVRRLIVLPMKGGYEDLRQGENVADDSYFQIS